MKAKIQVVLCNLQGIPLREPNRARLKSTVVFIAKQGWEITIISEIRADRMTVIWMGSREETTEVMHSPKCGIILRGLAKVV